MLYDERIKLLKDYKKGMNILKGAKEEYERKLAEFKKENEELISNVDSMTGIISSLKEAIKEVSLEDYKVNNNKVMLGGVKVRIIKKYNYDENDALNWAKQNNTCLNLNKSAFKKVIKENDLSFVEKVEEASIVVPSNIVLEEGEI